MADEFLSEHEQGEQLKAWVRDNWAWVLSGVVVGLGIIGGWQFYQRYKLQQATAASSLLDEYAVAAVTDKAKAAGLFNRIAQDYGATPYATQAQLLQAQYSVENNDFAAAESTLRTVVDNSKDAQLAQVAKLRLARVLIEENKTDDALKLLDVDSAGAFGGLTHEVRGDALYAKQDLSGARSEYQLALDAFKAESSSDTSLLQLKLQDLGGDSASNAAQAVEAQQ